MSKKYVKKNNFVDAVKFDPALPPAQWPEGVEVDPDSPSGYFRKFNRVKNLKEIPSDPEPVVIEVRQTIFENDYLYNNGSGKKTILTESEFNAQFEEA